MPKRVIHNWLSRLAGGLTSGALALSVLSTGVGSAPIASVRPVLAEEIDCYNDKDLYNSAECVARREHDQKTGNAQNEAQGAPGGAQEKPGGGEQQASGGGSLQPSSGQQQAAQGGEEEEEKPVPRGPVTDPRTVVLTLDDAGKEATQYINDEGSDKFGKWVRTRFERDRTKSASTLGPNVMDSKAWVAKDLETAKGLFKEQAAVKNFPERKEPAVGSVEKIKPTSYGEEFSFVSAYYQDDDDKVWQHYRFAMRVGNVVSVLYLFGREEFFQDQKDKKWTGQGDWFTGAVYHRM
jgi:hypothetical protein